mmetsp:Transcript_37214/g.46550  ORF Transcript_37214/g.46550 Transcript_37214/m.46550 type:complete len:286 (-) Transcript_37214:47-904(-)
MSKRDAEDASLQEQKQVESLARKVLPLFALGFCGVDDTVEVEDVLQVNKDNNCGSFVEWGVLFRPEKEGQPRFASLGWVKKLVKLSKERDITLRLAAHLCSSRCEEVLRGDSSFVQELHSLGFKRVQVNATKANNVHIDDLETCVQLLKKAIQSVPGIEWIIQKNEETKPIWEGLVKSSDEIKNISILFDDSVGRGVKITSFSEPFSGIPCGYAGGIGPDNIEDILEQMSKSKGPHQSIREPWIDMESSLRTIKDEDDIFSLQRATKCVEIVQKLATNGILKLPE